MEVAEIIEMLRRVQEDGTYTTTYDGLEAYDLGGVDCPKCNNTGHIEYEKNGIWYSRECECMGVRRSMRRLKHSGMEDMLKRYTFDNYQTPDDRRKKIKEVALRFLSGDRGWFYIFGRSGSGKTHICSALCNEFMKKDKEVYYMSWRDESTALKGMITDSETYSEKVRKLKTVPVLYIDDFFKDGCSEADLRLAFEIINARYNDEAKRTIISSEWGIEWVMDKDEATGSRIYERSKGYVIAAPNENWRLRDE